MDDLTAKRMDYFNKKISTMQIQKVKNEREGFNFNNIPDNIKDQMKGFNIPIDMNNENYESYKSNLINIIESANDDLEFGKYSDSLEKLESVLYYLIQIKKN